MEVRSNRHVNLHSKSSPMGLVHVPAGPHTTKVPSDVKDEPGFDMLVREGIVFVVIDDEPESEPELEESADEPETTEELEESSDEEPNSEEESESSETEDK